MLVFSSGILSCLLRLTLLGLSLQPRKSFLTRQPRWALSSLNPRDPGLWARETGPGYPNTQMTSPHLRSSVPQNHIISHLQMWVCLGSVFCVIPQTLNGSRSRHLPSRWEDPAPLRPLFPRAGSRSPAFSTGLVWTHKQPWGQKEESDTPSPTDTLLGQHVRAHKL